VKLTLTIIDENGDAQEVDLTPGSYIIGNDEDQCNVAIPDPHVSPQHCKVEFLEDHWIVCDLQSESGTMVNGNGISAGTGQKLVAYDQIQIGDTYIETSLGSQPRLSKQETAEVKSALSSSDSFSTCDKPRVLKYALNFARRRGHRYIESRSYNVDSAKIRQAVTAYLQSFESNTGIVPALISPNCYRLHILNWDRSKLPTPPRDVDTVYTIEINDSTVCIGCVGFNRPDNLLVRFVWFLSQFPFIAMTELFSRAFRVDSVKGVFGMIEQEAIRLLLGFKTADEMQHEDRLNFVRNLKIGDTVGLLELGNGLVIDIKEGLVKVQYDWVNGFGQRHASERWVRSEEISFEQSAVETYFAEMVAKHELDMDQIFQRTIGVNRR